jgi:hypothetical protein
MVDPVTPSAPPRTLELVTWALVATVGLLFLALKAFSLHWEIGDENIYFYMASATARHGALPYRDYFFAHPPLHLAPGVALFALGGFNIVTARLIPIAAQLVAALFVALIARRHLGRAAAVVSVLLYLGAFDLLRASSHWTGINLSTMWMVIGLWALLGQRHRLAGITLALGVCTGTYVLPAAMMAAAVAVLTSRQAARRYLAGFLVPWAAVQLSCLVIGGKAYLASVYLYHVEKPDAPGAAADMMVRVFGDNFALFWGAVLATTLALLRLRGDRVAPQPVPAAAEHGRQERKKGKRRRPERQQQLAARASDRAAPASTIGRLIVGARRALLEDGPHAVARLMTLWVLGTVIFIAVLPRVFPFYFLLLFPSAALLGGHLAGQLVEWAPLVRDGARRARTVAALATLLALIVAGALLRGPIQHHLAPTYVRHQDRPMRWQDAPLPSIVNGVLRRWFFDDVARAETDYSTLQEYLYHEGQYFERAEELAQQVKARSRPEQRLFGDSSTAGLVALLAGRRLAGDEADTNTMRFRSGLTDPAALIRRVDTPELALVLVHGDLSRSGAPRYGLFASLPEFTAWLDRGFRVVYQVQDRTKGWYFLLGRRGVL